MSGTLTDGLELAFDHIDDFVTVHRTVAQR